MRAIVLALLAACSGSTHTPTPIEPPTPPRAVSTEASIYDLDITLSDNIALDVSRGSPVLVTMFYASCSVACPALIADVKRTVAEIGRDDVRVLLVSFDPERDTSAKLAELARVHDLDARWTLAAASERDARELAATLGYKYRKLANGEFFHGATVVALDEEGRPIARSEGFNQRAPLLHALR